MLKPVFSEQALKAPAALRAGIGRDAICIEDIQAVVQAEMPALPLASYLCLQEGVIRTGDTVIKWASQSWREPHVAQEAALLTHLAGSKLPVPVIIYTGKDFPFFAMKAMPGKSVAQSNFYGGAFSPKGNESIGVGMGTVIAGVAQAMSGIDPVSLYRNTGQVEAHKNFTAKNISACLESDSLRYRLGKDWKKAARIIEDYQERFAQRETSIFCHDDLSNGHVFIKPMEQDMKFSGIIDFGHMAYNRAEFFLSGLTDWFVNAVTRQTTQTYASLSGMDLDFKKDVLACNAVAKMLPHHDNNKSMPHLDHAYEAIYGKPAAQPKAGWRRLF
jgi:Phosphotransferase enzyme family